MHRLATIAIALLLLAVGCGESPSASSGVSPNPSPSTIVTPSRMASPVADSPTPSPSPPGTPSWLGDQGTMFVLVDRVNAGEPSHYKLAIVRADGTVLKVLAPGRPSVDQTAQGETAPPLVSISRSRVYYLDGDTAIRYLSRDGTMGLVLSAPGGPKRLVSFAVNPEDTWIAVGIFDYSAGRAPTVTITIQDLTGHGYYVPLKLSTTKAEWPVAWYGNRLILAVGSSLVGPPTGLNPFAVPNPYNATDGYLEVDGYDSPIAGLVDGTTAPECAYGLLVPGGTPCWRTGLGVGFRSLSGTTTWYPDSFAANFYTREALAPDGTVAANSSPGGIGLFKNGSRIDFIAAIGGSAVPMGWIDSNHLVVRRFNGPATATIVDPYAGTTLDVPFNCGPTAAQVACTAPEMFGTF